MKKADGGNSAVGLECSDRDQCAGAGAAAGFAAGAGAAGFAAGAGAAGAAAAGATFAAGADGTPASGAFSRMRSSVRRLIARPSAVSFVVFGCVRP